MDLLPPTKSKKTALSFLVQTRKHESVRIRSDIQELRNDEQDKLSKLLGELLDRHSTIIPSLKMESVVPTAHGFQFTFSLIVTERLKAITREQVHELVRLEDDLCLPFITNSVKNIRLCRYSSTLPFTLALNMRP